MTERFEARLAAVFQGVEQRGSPLSDVEVNSIRDILIKMEKKTWAARPRTYAVLRMIDKLDLMDSFANQNVSDYNFPYKMGNIPLCVKGPTLRRDFSRKQILVLTDIKGAEKGQHSYLGMRSNSTSSYTDPLVFGILLEPIADCDLKAYLSRAEFPTVDLMYLRDFFGCIASAITYLHRNSCRHKDITANNVLVKHNKPYVTDFGLALDWSELSKSKTEGQVGAVSRHYVAPEVWDQKGKRGSASDMWALGCVFLDIATVLKGRTLQEKKSFFEKNGTGGANPRENFEGYELWVEGLGQNNPRQDALPLIWTKKLVLQDPGQRSDAEELLSDIRTCTDEEDGYIYHCEPDSLKVSYDLENIDLGLCNAVKRGSQQDSWTWLKRWTTRTNYLDEMKKSQALHLAALGGFTGIASDLLKHGFDVNATFNQASPLHLAIERIHIDISKLLLEQGANPNARDLYHRTPLHLACSLGLEAVVQLLIDGGADANATDALVSTPLHYAVRSGQLAPVVALLKQPDIERSFGVRETQASLTTPFFAAVMAGSIGIVQAFISFGIDVNTEESVTRYAPLHAAASAEKVDVAELLIEKGARVNEPMSNEWGAPPVFLAVQRGNQSMVRLLVRSGADPGATDRSGFSVIHAMVNFDHLEFLPIFLECGFDINLQTRAGQTPIAFALQLRKFDLAQKLLDAGASLHAGYAAKERSLLHDAAITENTEVIRFLLRVKEGGIPVDVPDIHHMTPLMRAAQRGGVKAAALLLENNANIEFKGREEVTALHLSVIHREKAMVELLLNNRAEINVQTRNGLTPLHMAALDGNAEIARLLLERRADMKIRNGQGRTALRCAKELGLQEMVEILGGGQRRSALSFLTPWRER
ncbi:hypothetical protein S40288_05370 [Stachybotrys chartarum IBT 40288]|nr:hypothetical protein S40288_05370 [Stachybotrys chartarum IBT 40288]